MNDPVIALQGGAASILERQLGGGETDLFIKYLTLLIEWNRSQRLVGSDRPDWIVEHVFLDSLLFLRVLPGSMRSMLDLGSGAGVPGIPIKIVRPDLRLILVESRRKRASFLSTVVRELGLEDVSVLAGRVEDLGEDLKAKLDAVVMRCAGDVEALFPVAVELVTASGVVVASGPPSPAPTRIGRWVSVEGHRPGTRRRFLVFHKS